MEPRACRQNTPGESPKGLGGGQVSQHNVVFTADFQADVDSKRLISSQYVHDFTESNDSGVAADRLYGSVPIPRRARVALLLLLRTVVIIISIIHPGRTRRPLKR